MKEMLSFIKTAVFAAALAGSTAPGYCFTLELGLLTPTPFNDTRSFKHDAATNPINDYYYFETNQTLNIGASVNNTFTNAGQYINDFTIALYRGSLESLPIDIFSFAASSGPIASGTNTVPNDPIDTEVAKLKAFNVAAGNFYLQVTGTTLNSPSYGGSLAVTLSTVPLPASAPMFGAALLGLGAVGYAVKRRKVAAAA